MHSARRLTAVVLAVLVLLIGGTLTGRQLQSINDSAYATWAAIGGAEAVASGL